MRTVSVPASPASNLRLLDRDDAVGAGGRRRSGHDPQGRAGAKVGPRRIPGGDDAVDWQRGVYFDFAAEGEAVHRRDVVGGYVDGGGQAIGEHPADRVGARHPLDVERLRLRGDRGPGVLGGEHGGLLPERPVRRQPIRVSAEYIGRYIEMTMPPMTTPRTVMSAGSSSFIRLSTSVSTSSS